MTATLDLPVAPLAETYPFAQPITSVAELREIVGDPGPTASRKVLPGLDDHCRNFIGRSPFVLVGTSSPSLGADVSPRGDAPGFALVLDAKTLLIPDRPGNRRIDSFLNVLENPRVGLLFMVPGVEETLRVNGRAILVRDPELLARMVVQDKTPHLAMAVHVDEAFLHCAKALRRSRLWQAETWPERSVLPTGGQIWIDHSRLNDITAAELDCELEEIYAKTMY